MKKLTFCLTAAALIASQPAQAQTIGTLDERTGCDAACYIVGIGVVALLLNDFMSGGPEQGDGSEAHSSYELNYLGRDNNAPSEEDCFWGDVLFGTCVK